MKNPYWFRRPGIESTFTPRLGTAHEWITSEEVVRSWTCVSIGRTARCSTSRRRKSVG